MRAGRYRREKLPKPRTSMRLPDASASVRLSTSVFTAAATSLCASCGFSSPSLRNNPDLFTVETRAANLLDSHHRLRLDLHQHVRVRERRDPHHGLRRLDRVEHFAMDAADRFLVCHEIDHVDPGSHHALH